MGQAMTKSPNQTKYYTQLGYLNSIKEDLYAATEMYNKAVELDLDGTNIQASKGLIKCQILQGKLQDAKDQMEFLNEVIETKSSDMAFLDALLAWNEKFNQEETLKLLDKTVELFMNETKDLILE